MCVVLSKEVVRPRGLWVVEINSAAVKDRWRRLVFEASEKAVSLRRVNRFNCLLKSGKNIAISVRCRFPEQMSNADG